MPGENQIDPAESVEKYIGGMIRDARIMQGWSQRELAKRVFSNTTRISEAENGSPPPELELARKLDQVLQLNGRLANLVEAHSKEGFADYAKPFLRRQAKAKKIWEYSPIVPGLLQTQEYATVMMKLAYPEGRADLPADIERRLARQAILSSAKPPWLWVVLAQSALTQHMPPGVMAKQLDKLLDAIERPNVNIQVLPAEALAVIGSISLLTGHDGIQTAYTEGLHTGQHFEEEDEVDRVGRIYDRLRADALGPERSENHQGSKRDAHMTDGWHTSSYSQANDNCVDVNETALGGHTMFRDTKLDGESPIIAVGHSAWETFLALVK